MEVFLIRALQLILCFSILILLHELGHFLFAGLFKVRVDKFYLFFNPKGSIMRAKKINGRWQVRFFAPNVPPNERPKKDTDGNTVTDSKGYTVYEPIPLDELPDDDWRKYPQSTEWGIGWVPLGGYCKISGMIDESMDKVQMEQPVKPWEFRAKPAWQRLLIMIGGVLVNFLLAFFIYAMVLFTWGDTYTPIKNMTNGFKFNETAQQLGFRDGDIPLRTDIGAFDRFDSSESIGDMYRNLSEATSVTVLRAGHETTFSLPGDLNMLQMIKEQPPFATLLMPSLIDSVAPGSPAAKAGVQAGDRLVAFNGTSLSTWNEWQDLRGRMNDVLIQGKAADSLRLRNITIAVQRAGSGRVDTLQLQLGKDFMMGTVMHNPMADYKQETIEYDFFSSFPAGINHGWNVLTGYVNDLKYLFTKDGAQSVGSFGAIGSLFPTHWQWERFWELTAFISLMLAFMNILPIPALDGGHVLFLLYEVVTRRKPSDRFMEIAQTVGMSLLLLLMAYAIFNDVVKFVF